MNDTSVFDNFFKGKPPIDQLIREKKSGEGWTVVKILDDSVVLRHYSAGATTRVVSKQDILTKFELVERLVKSGS